MIGIVCLEVHCKTPSFRELIVTSKNWENYRYFEERAAKCGLTLGKPNLLV
jgi:hypothetical protein